MKKIKKDEQFSGRGAGPLVEEVSRNMQSRLAFYEKGWDEAMTFLLLYLGSDSVEIEGWKDMIAEGVLAYSDGRFSPDGAPLPLSVRTERLTFQRAVYAELADRLEERVA